MYWAIPKDDEKSEDKGIKSGKYVKEIELLKDCLKQRQFLLEGFKCKLDSEKELVEFYKKIIEENYRDIIIWSKAFWQYSDDAIEEFPDGEFPEGEEIP